MTRCAKTQKQGIAEKDNEHIGFGFLALYDLIRSLCSAFGFLRFVMKKNASSMCLFGVALYFAGTGLMEIMDGWEYDWIPVPVYTAGAVILIFGLARMRKE